MWKLERYKLEQAASDRFDELVKNLGGQNVQIYRASGEWIVKYKIKD